LSVTGTEIVEEYEVPSCGLAPITSNCDVQDSQSQYNVLDLSGNDITWYAVDCDDNAFIWFDPATPGTFNYIGSFPSTEFPQGATFVEDVEWVCDDIGRIWTVDEKTGDTTYIGDTGTGKLTGLAYHEKSKIMYGCSTSEFYEINMSDGKATLIGTLGCGGLMISIDCDANGVMYGYDVAFDNSYLYSINLDNGRAFRIGKTGVSMNYGQDMSYDLDNKIMYACIINYDLLSVELCSVNLETGEFIYMADLDNGHQTSCFAIPYNISLPPYAPSTPSGPTEGVVDVEYTFCTSTTDPEGEQVYYMWDWGDGTPSEWTYPYDSGATACASHAWTEIGHYNITVKAKDVRDEESECSDPLTIHIVNTAILEIGNITGNLFKVSAAIRNIGGVDATNVSWSVTLDGGIILLGKETSGNILSLSAGGEKTISSDSIFGFGNTIITVTAECDEGSSDTKTRDAFVLLFFILQI